MEIEKCVLTIGKFEGIHCGHQALIKTVESRAKAKNLTSVVAIFEPHPAKILREPNYKPIFTESERASLIHELGVDKIITLPFNSEVAQQSPEEFACEIFEKLNAREVVIGENYRFGKNREGTIELLRKIADKYSAQVHVFKTMPDISTSYVRELLVENKLNEASQLLGHPFFIAGIVTKGRQLGRVIGFPTLNLYPKDDKFLPENGVYKTRTLINNTPMDGITNIGYRPTVSDSAETAIETHIPKLVAMPDEMYGKHIKVEFLRFIRPERRFDSIEELQSQIQTDIKGVLT
ncbi:MAG: riboflavin biosynthesis protein RibF [Defluviitaleaceae bacterium]|nr:riboflavin biosynthesis protein RibF [Defluviitaleaceae bacterium]